MSPSPTASKHWSLAGRRALVSGSTQGIGKAIAIALAEAGATVDLLARNADGLTKVLQELPTPDGQQHGTVIADFGDWRALERVAHEHVRKVGAIHILVNNTGGPPAGLAIDARPEDYVTALSMHIACFQALAQACVPGMREAGYGRIINITSTSVVMPIKGLGVSNTVRAAVGNWTRTLASELGRFGITVNNILPGLMDTGALQRVIDARVKKQSSTEQKVRSDMAASIPMARLGLADDFGPLCAFLCSRRANYITAQNIAVDGGLVRGLI